MYTCAHAQRVLEPQHKPIPLMSRWKLHYFHFGEGEIEIEGEKNREKERK